MFINYASFQSTHVETEALGQIEASPKLEPVSNEALLEHHGKHLYSLFLVLVEDFLELL
jgi:hypothetical protein